MDDKILQYKIDWINALLTLPFETEQGKMVDISFALMDITEYCMENGIISPQMERLPPAIEDQLAGVFQYLGDPLWS